MSALSEYLQTEARIKVLERHRMLLAGRIAKMLRGEPVEVQGEIEKFIVRSDGMLLSVWRKGGYVVRVAPIEVNEMET